MASVELGRTVTEKTRIENRLPDVKYTYLTAENGKRTFHAENLTELRVRYTVVFVSLRRSFQYKLRKKRTETDKETTV